MPKRIIYDHNHDGIDRRGFLECMAWAGAGALCVLSGGVLKSYALAEPAELRRGLTDANADFSFVQLSDSHRVQQGGQSRRERHASGGHRQNQRLAHSTCFHPTHRRHHAALQTR